MRDGSLGIYALTREGLTRAGRLVEARPGAELWVSRALAGEAPEARVFDRLGDALGANFHRLSGHVLFCAAGIAVRLLAPMLLGKDRDPAVVVVDQEGKYAVSLISGHLGGANELARWAAGVLGGRAVITTATDTAGLPSLEMVAREAGLKVENLAALAGVSGRLLAGRTVGVYDPGDWLWPRLTAWPGLFTRLESRAGSGAGEPWAAVDWRCMQYPAECLLLRPPALALGVGCNRGTSLEELREFVGGVLEAEGICTASVASLASVDLKGDEPGLLALAEYLGVEFRLFSLEELNSVEAPNPSEMVERHLGVKSVCEAAAMLAAGSRRLILEKRKKGNATLAVALAAST